MEKIVKLGTTIKTTGDIPDDVIYASITRTLIDNGVLLMDKTVFSDSTEYSWSIKVVKKE